MRGLDFLALSPQPLTLCHRPPTQIVKLPTCAPHLWLSRPLEHAKKIKPGTYSLCWLQSTAVEFRSLLWLVSCSARSKTWVSTSSFETAFSSRFKSSQRNDVVSIRNRIVLPWSHQYSVILRVRPISPLTRSRKPGCHSRGRKSDTSDRTRRKIDQRLSRTWGKPWLWKNSGCGSTDGLDIGRPQRIHDLLGDIQSSGREGPRRRALQSPCSSKPPTKARRSSTRHSPCGSNKRKIYKPFRRTPLFGHAIPVLRTTTNRMVLSSSMILI
ncbi:hypothetical protein B0H12DRAFT_1083627 [Mycena haematopus]|nr:hypothetical protein B0H12DRAFT_1083627 [Mycena haematopus]